MTSQHQSRVNWSEVIEEVQQGLAWFNGEGMTPKLRTMFYRLVSLEKLPNTESAYKAMSRATAEARRDGRLPIACFVDNVRAVYNEPEEYVSPQHYIDRGIHYLKNASKNYQIPRWHGQPNYVEVWLEKDALTDVFLSFLGDREVPVVPNSGYSSLSFLHSNLMRIARKLREGKDVHVIYFGDYDPSGVNMDQYLNNEIARYVLEGRLQSGLALTRMAVTKEQITAYGLPPKPSDPKTLMKLHRDSRLQGFLEKHDGELYAVELDALVAVNPDRLKRSLQRVVDSYFDQSIYARLLDLPQHKPKAIDRLVNKQIKFKQGVCD